MQVGRSAFMVWGSGDQLVRARNFLRITIWLGAAGVLWVAGALLPAVLLPLWLAALAIEYAGPWARFAVPILGASPLDSWDVDPHHMAERCALFVIIALGESIILAGASFADLEWTPATIAAFAGAFVGTVAMWWIYFDSGSERAVQHFEHAADRGRVARLAYTYLHIPIIAGIVVCAVADELVLVHPEHADNAGIAAILGGPFLYLLGNALFKWVTNQRRLPPFSHMVGLAVLAALSVPAFGHAFSALALGWLTTATLMLVALWEWFSLQRGKA